MLQFLKFVVKLRSNVHLLYVGYLSCLLGFYVSIKYINSLVCRCGMPMNSDSIYLRSHRQVSNAHKSVL